VLQQKGYASWPTLTESTSFVVIYQNDRNNQRNSKLLDAGLAFGCGLRNCIAMATNSQFLVIFKKNSLFDISETI
jgi:hypothetical protein